MDRKVNSSIPEIYSRYSSPLFSYIRNRVRTREDAEDILQDVFYQLSRSINEEGNDIERISGWLYRVARNSMLNLWRKKREETLDFPDDDESIDAISDMLGADSSQTPENVYLRKLVWQELEYALAELPPEQCEVFCLSVFEGVPVKVIAGNTGVPVATVLSRKHYAVKHLRIRLKGLYEDLI